MVYPLSQAGSRLPRMVTRLTVTSAGKVTCNHGFLPLAAESSRAVNQDVSRLPSKAWPVGHPGQNELAARVRFGRCWRINVFLLSVLTGGSSRTSTFPGLDCWPVPGLGASWPPLDRGGTVGLSCGFPSDDAARKNRHPIKNAHRRVHAICFAPFSDESARLGSHVNQAPFIKTIQRPVTMVTIR